MFRSSHQFEVGVLIVRPVVIPVVNVESGRDRTAVVLPDNAMEPPARTLEVGAAAVIPEPTELLNCSAENPNPLHASSISHTVRLVKVDASRQPSGVKKRWSGVQTTARPSSKATRTVGEPSRYFRQE